MRSELHSNDWSRRAEPSELPEWMDEPCTYEQLRACLRDLRRVNQLTFGYRPTLLFLDRIAATRPAKPLRILDVGFGGGDALQKIANWSQSRSLPVRLTGIDLNPLAKLIAAELYGGNAGNSHPAHTEIDWLTGDALAYQGEVDIVISSLLTHHLATGHVVRFLRWMEQTAALGWFVNDLERSARSANLFALLASVMRWHPFVRHDGPVSFARSFNRQDWTRMFSEADLGPNRAQLEQHFPSRLCVSRVK